MKSLNLFGKHVLRTASKSAARRTSNPSRRRGFELLESRVMLDGAAGDDHPAVIDPHSLDPQAAYFELNHERIYNFAQNPDAITVAEGTWNDPSIWQDGIAPQVGDRIQINHAVDFAEQSYAAYEAININPGGTLAFSPEFDTRLEVGTLTVLWGGTLEIGTDLHPIEDDVTAEIVIDDRPLDLVVDASQHGTGVLVLGGRLETNGRNRSHAFAEFASDAEAGDLRIQLAEFVHGWLPGDRLFLPDTRGGNNFSQAEFVIIESVLDSGEIFLESPLQFDHRGLADFMPHAAHLGGNIVVRSENPDGIRGHVLIAERSIIDVNDTVWKDLGRTTVDQLDNTHFGPHHEVLHVGDNQVGRYSFHMHHVYGPEETASPYQFEFVNNVIVGGEKWGLAIHDSHYGLIEGNVVVDVAGAGIVFEDGSETGNLLQGNFTALHRGSGEGETSRNNGVDASLAGDGSPGNPYRTVGDHGHAGTGIWARGSNNILRDNVVANAEFAGMFIWTRFVSDRHLPAFRGANPTTDFLVSRISTQVPGEFSRNEVYVSTKGFAFGGAGQETTETYKVDHLTAWGVTMGIEGFYSGDLEFEDIVLYGSGRVTTTGLQLHPSVQWFSGDRLDVRNFGVGLGFGGVSEISDSFFDNLKTNINLPYTTPGHWNRAQGRREPDPVVIDNVRFGDQAPLNISVTWPQRQLTRNQSMTYPRDVIVHAYNGLAGDDFQVWMREQAPEFVMPYSGTGDQSNGETRYSPVEGATNQQLWETYRISVGGRLLPALATERAGINGLVTPHSSELQPPTIFDVRVERTSPTEAVVRWSTDEPATSQVEWSDRIISQGVYGNLTIVDHRLRTEHAVTLKDLLPDTIYYYRAFSHDALGNAGGYGFDFVHDVAKHADRAFATSSELSPKMGQEAVIDVTESTANARFITSVPATARARVTAPDGQVMEFMGNASESIHAIPITGLQPGIQYKAVFYATSLDGEEIVMRRRPISFATHASFPEPPSIPGDYNRDGSIGAGDYSAWRDSLGSHVLPNSSADGTGDGYIGHADYDVWKVSFGVTVRAEALQLVLADQSDNSITDPSGRPKQLFEQNFEIANSNSRRLTAFKALDQAFSEMSPIEKLPRLNHIGAVHKHG